MSTITVNGVAQEVQTPILLIDLIKLNKVSNPDMVSIQLNGAFVNRQEYETTSIKDGDEVDFLYFMGGGQQ